MFLKLPSIHWKNTSEERWPEKNSGMIYQGDEDYKQFFEIAKENKFGIIFDGLAIDGNAEC